MDRTEFVSDQTALEILIRLLVSAFFLLLTVCRLWALDQKVLLEHIRESYQIPYHIEISLGDLKPSVVPGFQQAELRIGPGEDAQKEMVYISANGRHYLVGNFKDVSIHPDRERLRKVDISRSQARGSRSAPVAVLAYTDFQCPYCKRGYDMMQKLLDEFGHKVRWVYKSLPLESIHPWAESAAIAVECAGLQGEEKFWKVHDLFFERQREVTNANIEAKVKEFVNEAGAASPKFDACWRKKETRGRVRKDLAEAGALGINGTPAFLVNGHLVSGADYETLKTVVREALDGKHGGNEERGGEGERGRGGEQK